MLSGRRPPVSLLFCWVFFPPWTSEEILLSDYIACESAFLAGRALLSTYLYDLAGEQKGNFSTVYCDMSVYLAVPPKCSPSPACSALQFCLKKVGRVRKCFLQNRALPHTATNHQRSLKQDFSPLTKVRCLCFRGPQLSFVVPMDSCVWVPTAARAFLEHFFWMNEVIAVHTKF